MAKELASCPTAALPPHTYAQPHTHYHFSFAHVLTSPITCVLP